MPDHPVITAANAFRARLERADAQALNRLIEAYGRAYQRLATQIDALIIQIGDGKPTRGQLTRMRRYNTLMDQIAAELQGFGALTRNEIERASELGIQLGVSDGRDLLSYAATGTPEIAASFNVLPVDAIKTALGFLDPDGPLYARLLELAPQTARIVSDKIIQGITLGYNPAKTARMVQGAFGQGLTDAMRFVRTAQIWSYREANRATYVANADVLEGWYWHANIGDPRTCMSCIVQHGSLHPLDEPLNDHHSGRCAPIPAVKGFPPPIEQSGEEWFSGISETMQRQMMGRKRWEAWSEGKFEFGAQSVIYQNDVYGAMRREQSLKGLLEG